MTVLFEKADKNQLAMVTPLLQNASFMRVALEDLQTQINAEGCVDAYQNGNAQHGYKTSAALQAYNSLGKLYAGVIKQLTALVPPEEKPKMPPPWERFTDTRSEEEKQADFEKARKDARRVLSEQSSQTKC